MMDALLCTLSDLEKLLSIGTIAKFLYVSCGNYFTIRVAAVAGTNRQTNEAAWLPA